MTDDDVAAVGCHAILFEGAFLDFEGFVRVQKIEGEGCASELALSRAVTAESEDWFSRKGDLILAAEAR